MFYLSQLALNLRSAQVRSELRDPYQMHRTLAHGFDHLGDRYQNARVLFRVDDDCGDTFVIVQSQLQPNWSGLRAREGYLRSPAKVKELDFTPAAGESFRFRLQANPTRQEGTGKNRKGIYIEWDRLDWLNRKARYHGFALETKEHTIRKKESEEEFVMDLPLVRTVDLNDGQRFAMPGQGAQFSAVRFDGTLTVTDSEKFGHALHNGIGKARAFGFGLLSLARP